jgi:hypothetical protein
MARTSEGVVKDNIKKVLKSHGVYYHMPVMNGMGAPALDFHCIHKGMAFCIEAKRPGKLPTPRQELTIKDIEAAGGKCFVIDGEPGLNVLEWWLDSV